MTEIIEGQNREPVPEKFIEESPGIIKPSFNYGNTAIEKVLGNPDFREQYPFSTEVEMKYALARVLISDGRYEDPVSLLNGLVPTQTTLSRSSASEERKAQILHDGKVYRDSLENFMVERGLIQPKEWSVRKATHEATKYITNNERFKDFVSFFGSSNAVDILYRLHPQYRGIHPERVKGLIADYLGDFLLQTGPLNLDNVVDKLPYLSEPDLRQGLVEVWKRDVLSKVSKIRLDSEDYLSDEEVLQRAFDEYSSKVLESGNEDLIGVFDEIEKYYLSLSSISKPEHIIGSLNGGRLFPDFNQRINIKELSDKKRLLIADEMGMGKSASVILAKEILGVKTALIIAPSNVVNVWQNFLSDRKDETGQNTGYFIEGKAPRILTVENPDDLVNQDLSLFDYIIISQERLNDNHMSTLKNLDVGMLIVDEFHKLKNLREGVRAGHLIDLAEKIEGDDKYVALLSGTPVPNKVEDIAVALKLLYPDKFENVDNSTLIKSIIQGDIVDIRSLLLPRMQAKSLAESIKMPCLEETVEYYDLQGIEKDIYEELLDDDELPSTTKLQLLRQFLLNPELVDPTPGLTGTKVGRLSDLLSQKLTEKEKIVVYVNDFTNGVIRGEGNILEKLGLPDYVRVEIIDGPIPQEERQRIQHELGNYQGKMVVFVSGQTADVGVDFSAADSVDFYNEPWSRYTKHQQLGRVYRPGVKHSIESTSLVGRGTIEEGINRYVLVKERAIEKLLKGIPVTEIEKQILERSEKDVDKSLGVNPELAEYYFSSWDRMQKIFGYVKGIGQEKFLDFLRKYAQSYAGAYVDLGSRSYQANACRVSGTLIDTFVEQSGIPKQDIKIFDIASGPEMLRRHIPDGYEGNIYSLDINKQHFSNESQNSVVGSFLKLPLRDETFDYANLTLAWHYTSFAPGKEDFERIEVLAEANRVLKKGGRLILNNIYSYDIKNHQLFEELVWALGFRIIPEYSGQAKQGQNYTSHVYTLEKVEYPGLSSHEIAQLIGKDHYDGLKLIKSDERVKDSRKVIEGVSIGETVIPLRLNQMDRQILRDEKEIVTIGENLKQQFDGIENIPGGVILENNFIRILVGDKYVLFKKVPSSAGAVVIR